MSDSTYTPAPVADAASVAIDDRSPRDVAELLRRPFHPDRIRSRPVGGGKTVNYVAIEDVIDRLNRAAPVWSWRATDIAYHSLPIMRGGKLVDTLVCHVTGELVIPGLGSRGGIGTAPCENNEDAAKIAEADAIKRAANNFGVPGGR